MKTLTVLALSMCLAATASAQVNKCTVDGKVTYTSEPCAAGKAQAVDIPLRYAPAAPGTPTPTKNAYAAELNNKIADALKRDDFATARRLAVTDEHFRIIAEVEQITREESQAAKAEKRARRPTICNTMGQSNGQFDADTRYGSGRATTSGNYRGTSNSTTICNK